MKIPLLISALALFASIARPQSSIGDSAPATNAPYVAVERGPHYTVWQAPTNQDSFPEGSSGVHLLGRYVELGTGLNHWDPVAAQYVPSSDQIVPTATGAIAANAQHQVTFLGDINTAGAVSLTTPDGLHLNSSVLGLSYYDSASGQSVMFAQQVQDSTGQILPSVHSVTSC